MLDDYCFCRCCQLLNSKKGCFFALSMAHVFQTILSVDVKEKAIAALISTLKMVHSTPLLIINATGTFNRLPSKAIAALGAYSLIHRDPVEKTLSIHRLVQVTLRDSMDVATAQLWLERAIRLVLRARSWDFY